MIFGESLLKVLHVPHVSEKSSTLSEMSNTVVVKVAKDATKTEIKASIQKFFKVEVKTVNTLIIRGKIKRHGKHIIQNSNWKKAYISLKKGNSIDFSNRVE